MQKKESVLKDDVLGDKAKRQINKKEKSRAKIQEEERDVSSSYVPIYEIKGGTRKNRRIHQATKQLGLQSVSDICEEFGFLLNVPQIQQILDYLLLVQKWNQSMNLVGKSSWKDVLSELVIDSMHLARFLFENPRIQQEQFQSFSGQMSKKKYAFTHNVNLFSDDMTQVPFNTWDLGAGAGLPGIPLRVLWQLGEYTMVELREKRSIFLNTALMSLTLPQTKVYRGKAEDFMEENKQKNIYADLIVSRAFMPMEKMLPFVSPYLRKAEQNLHNENINKTQASIIFLTLEEFGAKKIKNPDFQWETKQIYPYKIKGKQKFLCEVICKN